MVKILVGLVAALVIAVGGFFGFGFYMEHRVADEVEAAFEQIRATGVKASHGKVSFDVLNRTVTVADIVSESAAQPPVSMKIASLTVSGAKQPDAARFSADSIEANDVEIGAGIAAQPGWRFNYNAPRITVKDYSGPAGPQQQAASSSGINVYGFPIERLAEITTASVTVPSIYGTMNLGAAMPDGEFAYSGLQMQGIKDGKIATSKADAFAFTANTRQAGKADKLTGRFVNLAAHDFDIVAVTSILDPRRAKDDRYYRVYRQISTGPYTIASQQGVPVGVDGATIDDVGVRPSRMQLPALLATIPPAGSAPPTPAQTRDMMEKAAALCEGIRVGNAEIRGLSADTPQGPFKLAAVRYSLENGKGDVALEGLDARSPQGAIKLGRFALKSLDLANLLRMSALFSDPAQRPSPDKALGVLRLLEGAEVTGLVAPYKDTNKTFNIDTFNLNWGEFVGLIPSRAHLATKLNIPINPADPNLKQLVAAGLDTAMIDFDLGAAWTEAPHTFVLEPVTIEIGRLLKASARISLANVPRGAFTPDPMQAMASAAQIEAGPIEIMVRDIGSVDLAVGQFARSLNVSPDAARRAIVDSVKADGAKVMNNPDAVAIVDAVVRFVETPQTTLTLKLTPRGKVPAMQIVQALKNDPLAALAQFQVEVSTAR